MALTPEEEQELARLKGEQQSAKPLSALSTGMSVLENTARGASLGFYDNYAAAVDAAMGQDPETGEFFEYGSNFGDRYRAALNKRNLREEKFEEEHPTTAIVTEVGGSMLPISRATKAGVTTANMLKEGAGFFKRALANAADAAIFSGVNAAIEDRDVGEAAGGTAAFSMLLQGLPLAVRKSIDAIAKKRIGQSLVDKAGNFIPLNMAAPENSHIRNLFKDYLGISFMSNVPKQSSAYLKAATEHEKKVAEAIHRGFQKQAVPEGFNMNRKAGIPSMKRLKELYKQAYEKAWQGATKVSDRVIKVMRDADTKGFDKSQKEKIKGVIDFVEEQNKIGGAASMKSADNKIRKAIGDNANDEGLRTFFAEMRKTFRSGVSPKVSENLNKVDAKYPTYLALKEAGSSSTAAKGQGVVTANKLLDASSKVGRKQVAFGEAPMQEPIRRAAVKEDARLAKLDWLQKSVPKEGQPITSSHVTGGLGILGGAMGGTTGALLGIGLGAGATRGLTTQGAQKFIAGQTGAQKMLRDRLAKYDASPYADFIRNQATDVGKALSARDY